MAARLESRPMIGRGRHAGGRWWLWLGLWTVVGLGIRLGTVIGNPDRVAGGDSLYYHNAANLLAEGKGFINPFLYYSHLHEQVQTASWPPLFVVILAAASLVGFKSFLAHRVWCCLIGTAAVVACGYTGRQIAGRRVGLIAAFLVAVYPNLWMSDELGLSETLSPLLVAVILLAAYRFWQRPGLRRAVALGVSIAVAALARDELSLLALLVLVPLTLMAKGVAWRRRVGFLAVGALASALVVAPWIGYNLSRFEKPVFISSGLGVTLASANCPATYSGRFIGYWQYDCALRAPLNHRADESVQASEAQSYALHFVRTHENRLLAVGAARLGRGFAFFHPLDQIRLDAVVETRPYHWALVGLGMYYALFALSIGGVVVLRRRRVPVGPLLAVGLDVAVSMLLTFGNTRYRTTFEVSLVLLAAVQLDWLWARLRRQPPSAGGPDAPVEGPADGLEEQAGGSDLVSQGPGLPDGAAVPAPVS